MIRNLLIQCSKVSSPGFGWQADFRKSKVKLELLTDINDMTDGLGMHYVTSLLIDMQKIINI